MDITNNILKHYLRNVYFFCGTACGGKTTISKLFAEKHGFLWVNEDRLNEKMASIAEPAHQRAWCSRPADWETYFNRPYWEYHEWLQDCGREMLPMEMMELAALAGDRKVAVDMHNLRPKLARELTEPNRVVYLVTTPERVVRDYYDRPGHREIYDLIMTLKNPQASLANCNKMLAYGSQQFLDEVLPSGLLTIVRDDDSTVEGTLRMVEEHFGMA